MEEITYLVPNYNNSIYIKDCIESLLAQTSNRWRCVICDDVSTDNSVDIIKPYLCDKIRLYHNDVNRGVMSTMKRLIDLSETDIVARLDPDDILRPKATEEILKAYDMDKTASFVYSRCVPMDNTMKYIIRPPIGSKNKGTSLIYGMILHIRSFRKTVYYKTVGADESMRYGGDRHMVYILEEVARPVFVNKILYKYRYVNDSLSNQKKKRLMGSRNHYRAIKMSLDRRNIIGLNRFLHKIIGRLECAVFACSRKNIMKKYILTSMLRKLQRFDDENKIRTSGIKL